MVPHTHWLSITKKGQKQRWWLLKRKLFAHKKHKNINCIVNKYIRKDFPLVFLSIPPPFFLPSSFPFLPIPSVLYTIFPSLHPLLPLSFPRSSSPTSELNRVGSVSSRGRRVQWGFSVANRKWQYIHYLCPHSSFLSLHTHTHTYTQCPPIVHTVNELFHQGRQGNVSHLTRFPNHFRPADKYLCIQSLQQTNG